MSSYSDLPFMNTFELVNTLAQPQICAHVRQLPKSRHRNTDYLFFPFSQLSYMDLHFISWLFPLEQMSKTACSVVKSLCQKKLPQYTEIINKNKMNTKSILTAKEKFLYR